MSKVSYKSAFCSFFFKAAASTAVASTPPFFQISSCISLSFLMTSFFCSLLSIPPKNPRPKCGRAS
uniref:Putative ovule protein n=1 Tax=Solanum chacoense TaxID=4108 RepID=A0A0V0GN45_SOLCH